MEVVAGITSEEEGEGVGRAEFGSGGGGDYK